MIKTYEEVSVAGKNYKSKMLILMIIAILFVLCSGTAISINAQADPGLIVYQGQAITLQNANYTVKVRKEGGVWQNLFCYKAVIGGNIMRPNFIGYVYFDANFSSRIEVQVTKNNGNIDSVKIRPLSYHITPAVNGNTISFFLDKPRKLSVEFNGDIWTNLHIFANPVEVNPPKQGDVNVQYFGPGVTNAGAITLSSNQTLYLAGGAYVTGTVSISNANNVKILGRGVLDNALSSGSGRMITISNSSNVTIDGIFIVGSKNWTVVPRSSDHITINNIKIINSPVYSDGIDPQSCQDVTINNVFIRNGDDCISIKNTGTENNSNITVKNSLLWSDGAHAVLFGPEGNGNTTSGITFDSIEVLEVNCPAGSEWWGVVGITNSGNVTMRDITLKNFNIDNFTRSELFNIRIETNQYVSTPGNCVKNIKYINWSYTGVNRNVNLIQGYDAVRCVDSISFVNLRINGQLILNAAQANANISSYAYHITFSSGPTPIQKSGLDVVESHPFCINRLQDNGGVRISIAEPGVHLVSVTDLSGSIVRKFSGDKPCIYDVDRMRMRSEGAYLINIKFDDMQFANTVFMIRR
jgi:hypothetical protein